MAATFAGAMLIVRTLAVPLRAWSWAAVMAGTAAQVLVAGLVLLPRLGAPIVVERAPSP